MRGPAASSACRLPTSTSMSSIAINSNTSIARLRRVVQSKLPKHMVPAVFVPLDALPLTANGKIDRRGLPPPETSTRASRFVAPRGHVEQTLADIWSAVLRRDQVG